MFSVGNVITYRAANTSKMVCNINLKLEYWNFNLDIMVVNPQSSNDPEYLTSESEAVLQFPVQLYGGANKTSV